MCLNICNQSLIQEKNIDVLLVLQQYLHILILQLKFFCAKNPYLYIGRLEPIEIGFSFLLQ